MRCAVYCRYSSDQQNPLSIDDQLRVCTEYAQRQKWEIAEGHTYKDEALSGAGSDRPGFTRLIRAALSTPAPFDVILIDDTSRLSRNLADGLQTVAQLKFAGVRVVAVSQQIDTGSEQAEVLMTVHGLVDSLFLKELSKKTHRGLEGRVLRGLPAGGRCYGYRNTPQGPVINEREASVVRRIFQMSADGVSLKVISRTLNRENIPGPAPRKNRNSTGWGHTEIRGILHRDLYRGVITWNRTHFEKRPGTNQRVCRRNPPEQWRTVQAEHLRIAPEDLWQKVQDRLSWVKQIFSQGRPPGFLSRTAGSKYLFSGLLVCGECGGKISIVTSGPHRFPRYGCRAYSRGTCKNGLTVRQEVLDGCILDGLQRAVLTPEVIDYTLQKFEAELKDRLREMGSEIETLRLRKSELESELRRLAAAVAEGGHSTFLLEAIADREKQLRSITDQILSTESNSLDSGLTDLRQWVHERLSNLRRLLSSDPGRAHTEFLKHTQAITLKPIEQGGQRFYQVSGAWNLLGDDPDTHCLLGVIARG
jgi:site-specific DNA recombinase